MNNAANILSLFFKTIFWHEKKSENEKEARMIAPQWGTGKSCGSSINFS
jgi:hypothetical protein